MFKAWECRIAGRKAGAIGQQRSTRLTVYVAADEDDGATFGGVNMAAIEAGHRLGLEHVLVELKTELPEDEFAEAYIRTALWSSNDDSDPETGGEPMDSNYTAEDIAPKTRAKMIADCWKFQRQTAETLAAAITTGEVRCGPDFDETGHAGHDFWLTRNGHGAGFWDGDWPEPHATELDRAAKAFGVAELYVGDDGLIYQAGAE